jgi:hypothetical protein
VKELDKFSVFVIIAIVGLICLVCGTRGQAYEGDVEGGNTQIVLAPVIVQHGIQAYYKIHHSWPSTWQDVVDEGLWQTSIPTIDGQALNPDDSSIDFFDDTYYAGERTTGQNGTAAVLMGGQPAGSPQVQTILVQPPKTYDQIFAELDPVLPANFNQKYGNDPAMLKLFGILGEVWGMHAIYSTVHGAWPSDLEEFLDSGLSPVTRDSINPVTGQTFKFDGSAGDVSITYGPTGPRIRHIERDGSMPLKTFTY